MTDEEYNELVKQRNELDFKINCEKIRRENVKKAHEYLTELVVYDPDIAQITFDGTSLKTFNDFNKHETLKLKEVVESIYRERIAIIERNEEEVPVSFVIDDDYKLRFFYSSGKEIIVDLPTGVKIDGINHGQIVGLFKMRFDYQEDNYEK